MFIFTNKLIRIQGFTNSEIANFRSFKKNNLAFTTVLFVWIGQNFAKLELISLGYEYILSRL